MDETLLLYHRELTVTIKLSMSSSHDFRRYCACLFLVELACSHTSNPPLSGETTPCYNE